ncbi:hypothetical protein [Moorena sp. SIO3A2]|uniref:hypothetical protein n=1 Tax=Moorena sp. SIO3A2 TaxID=2607841 RepID=UPI0013BE5D14|nr:hypothetical protein [Moorena sp. SIO3A2]NER87128.1 hypothetical protein [Moorena sp. SIO3A2]
MQLKEFSLVVPKIESGTVLKALEVAIPSSAIEQLKSGYKSQRRAQASKTLHIWLSV